MEKLSQLAIDSRFGYCCKMLCAVGTVLCILLLFTRSTRDFSADYNATKRKERALKDDIKVVRLKGFILERRIGDHFTLFCTQDFIDTEVPQAWYSFANCNTPGHNRGYELISVYKLVFLLTVCTILAITIMRQFPMRGSFMCFSNSSVFSAATFALSALAALCVVGVFSERNNTASKSAKKLKKLSSVAAKERKSYDSIVSGVRIYNSLPEWVRYEIRVSEHLSESVREQVLAGRFTEKAARRVMIEVEQESLDRSILCA